MTDQQREVDAAVAAAKAAEPLSEALDMADNGWAGAEDARVLAAEVRRLQSLLRERT